MKVNIYKLKEEDFVSYNLVKASWIQKSIRRGLNSKALSIAKLYIDDNQTKGLLRRLKVFATEDIGLGNIQSILNFDDKDPYEVVNLLCQSYKNREVDRFLLYTDRIFPSEKITNLQMQKEVYNLKKLINISSIWFNNKRKKSNKEDIYNFIDKMQDKYDSDSFQRQLVGQAIENYLELSKFKTLGARTNLAFAVLIITRQIRKELIKNKIDYSFNQFEELDIVDDWALDKHTSFGKKLNRDLDFWIKYGSVINPELNYSSLYLDKKQKTEKYSYEKIFNI